MMMLTLYAKLVRVGCAGQRAVGIPIRANVSMNS